MSAISPPAVAAPVVESRAVAHVKDSAQLLGVQMLRGVAALAVVVHHVLEESHSLFGGHGLAKPLVLFGAAGVDLFFVISGFIMLHTTWNDFGRPHAPSRFLLRRVVRIFPLYWACLAVVLLAKASGALYRSLEVTPGSLLGSLLLLPTDRLVIGVAWTLVFEMYFYYAFAVWLRFARPQLAPLVVPATLGAVSLVASLFPASNLQRYFTDPIVLEFVFGLLLAWLYRAGRTFPAKPLCLALGVAGMVAASLWAPSDGTAGLSPEVRFWCWGIPAALVVGAALSSIQAGTPLRRGLVALGNASYALYLSHEFVMIAYARLLKQGGANHWLPAFGWVALITGISVVLGFATHYAVEKPLTRWVRARVPAS